MNDSIIKFSMNYYALKTFGRQQYSNAWAALSELIANGFDAHAKNVYLYINMSEKKDSIIEIIDDGCGMDANDLETKYAIIGRNRRLETANDMATGRKGIGKLAALYLTDTYQIISAKDNAITAWKVNVIGKDDKDIPCLEQILQTEVLPNCRNIWTNIKKTNGTIIRLLHVDLTKIGERAIEALKHRLSNYFLFDSMNSKLHLCIVSQHTEPISFENVKKEIAFDNMSHIYYSSKQFIESQKQSFVVNFKDLNKNNKEMTVAREEFVFPETVTNGIPGNKIAISGTGTFYGKTKPYELTGWLGVHSSIDNTPALNNDKRFIRNNFYTPNQIRVYVRNKLANENILGRLNLTGTYANYIEGEVAFDILDDNDFEDIATTNRQDFSVVDERVILLLSLLKGLCRQLVQHRQELADKITRMKNEIDDEIHSQQKSSFANETHNDLLNAGIDNNKASELSHVIANKLKGNYELKTTYKIFISHASKDRIFTDFISHYLQFRGFHWDKDADKTDIFYSSDGIDITNGSPLPDIIKRMIVNDNTDILFLTSNNFLHNQYCLFEGGAAWATRAVLEYCIIALDYNSIPDFLTNKKPEFTFNTHEKDSFVLNQRSYSNLVIILNRLISHLNTNRTKANKTIVSLIPEPHFDDLVQMKKAGKTESDYMDPDVLQYWQTYVIDKLDSYFENNA